MLIHYVIEHAHRVETDTGPSTGHGRNETGIEIRMYTGAVETLVCNE